MQPSLLSNVVSTSLVLWQPLMMVSRMSTVIMAPPEYCIMLLPFFFYFVGCFVCFSLAQFLFLLFLYHFAIVLFSLSLSTYGRCSQLSFLVYDLMCCLCCFLLFLFSINCGLSTFSKKEKKIQLDQGGHWFFCLGGIRANN